jgi:hypothetical protein
MDYETNKTLLFSSIFVAIIKMHLINILELVLFVPLALPKTDRKTLQEAETSVLTEEIEHQP